MQAAAHAHSEAGAAFSEQLFTDVVRDATASRQGDEAIAIVVLAVNWTGVSEPNTVCGGACKGALVHVGELLEQNFERVRAREKTRLADTGVFVRESLVLSCSGSVRGRKEFGGFGTGALPDSRAPAGGREKVRHRYVRAYDPLGR